MIFPDYRDPADIMLDDAAEMYFAGEFAEFEQELAAEEYDGNTWWYGTADEETIENSIVAERQYRAEHASHVTDPWYASAIAALVGR